MASTIGGLLRTMFPQGTRPPSNGGESESSSWNEIPIWPVDVFAFCATIVEQSNIYLRIAPVLGDGQIDPLKLADYTSSPEFAKLSLVMTWGLHAFSKRSGPEWKDHCAMVQANYPSHKAQVASTPSDVISISTSGLKKLWATLVANMNFRIADSAEEPPNPALLAATKLMLISDDACRAIGFFPPLNKKATWIQGLIGNELLKITRRDDATAGDQDNRWFSSFTSDLFEKGIGGAPGGTNLCVFDSSACAVLPKTRTSTLGCTLRSMTHNLALLPPAHLVEARWRMSPFRPVNAFARPATKKEVTKNLNLLIVPFPYRIPLSAFEAKKPESKEDWGYFHTKQTWLPSDPYVLVSFVKALMASAERSIGSIHGVVFPEYALDGDSFKAVADGLREMIHSAKEGSEFEFLLSGTSELREDYTKSDGQKSGNFVQIIGMHRQAETGDPIKRAGVNDASWTFRGGRAKHHRWKVNGRQSSRYGLASVLDPSMSWWEAIPLERRVIEFYELRAGTSMTAMICEDLARADPVKSVIRSVGPNLVIALLMDGPQRSFRWPGHYAGVLADDPGSSVLTVTSLGLIERAAASDSTLSRAVAFFKDCKGNQQELNLPVGAHALAVSLKASAKEEHTLDRRGDGGYAYIWELNEVCSVRHPDGDAGLRGIMQ